MDMCCPEVIWAYIHKEFNRSGKVLSQIGLKLSAVVRKLNDVNRNGLKSLPMSSEVIWTYPKSQGSYPKQLLVNFF